jgi:hypothetical protein
MKKLLVLLIGLALVSLLTGCQDRTTLSNVEFVSASEVGSEIAALFETENGSEKILYVHDTIFLLELEEGEKYNVSFTVENLLDYGDVLKEVELVE